MKFFYNLNMRYKIVFTMIPLFIVALVIISAVGINRFSDYAHHSENENMENTLHKTYLAIDSWVNDRILDAERFVKVPSFVEACTGGDLYEAKTLLKELKAQTDFYEAIFLARPDGQIFLAGGFDASAISINISQLEAYAENQRESVAGKTWISAAAISPATGRPVVLITAPVRKNGQVVGILGMPLEINVLSETFIGEARFGESGYLYVIDKNASVIAYPEKEQILNLDLTQHDFVHRMLQVKNGHFTYPWQGKDVEVHFQTFPRTEWTLAVRINTEEFMAPIQAFKRLAIVMTIISVIAASLLIWLVTGVIANQIQKAIDMLKDIAQGEGDLTVRLEVKSRDEIGELAKWFNTFVEKLQTTLRIIMESSKQVAAASGNISSASEQMAAGAEEQQAQLSEVATSVEEMSAMILETSNNTEGTQQNAMEANEAAARGQEKVVQTLEGMEGIASIVATAAEQVGTLKERSEEIGEVIQVIDDIADQTNLLALNANIEAARAGDAGRGFAVVADEVRKLAERTVTATSNIGEKIKQIQADVASSVEAMGSITTQSEMGRTLASESGNALQEISGAIDQVNSAITQISSATVEQSAGVEEISKNIEGVSTVSKQSASSAQELAASAEQLNREVQSLETQISQFRV